MNKEKRIAGSVFVINSMLVMAGIFLLLRYAAFMNIPKTSLYFVTSMTLAYGAIAFLILSRLPKHTVGWLMLIVSLAGSVYMFSSGLETYGLQNPDAPIQLVHWMAEISWGPWLFIPLILLPLYFPDGELPSPRWWPVKASSWLVIFWNEFTWAFLPWEDSEYVNPFAIPNSELIAILDYAVIIIAAAFAIALVGSISAIVIRYRRSRGLERQQMKWFVYAIGLSTVLFIVFGLFGQMNATLTAIAIFSIPNLMAFAIGAAILQYRLFDIDLIIRRTLQYSIVSGVLALIYFGAVTSIQSLFFSGQSSQVAVVISTLAIAALFNPLRLRIQDVIDRRFYRTKYDAEQVLARFAAVAREEVELQKLTQALLDTVQETIQPEKASLWLVNRE